MPPNHHNRAEQARESRERDYIKKSFAIAILGYGRHGKDEAALTLHKTGVFKMFGSNSWAVLPEVAAKLNLPEQIAWEERHKNRELWKEYCDYLRRDNQCYIIEKVLARANIVSGIRGGPEIRAAVNRNLFDSILWIDRPGFPVDPTVDFDRSVATEVIINNGTLLEFKEKVLKWAWTAGYLTAEQTSAAIRRESVEDLKARTADLPGVKLYEVACAEADARVKAVKSK